MTLDDLRRHAVARSLFPPTTLSRALDRMGFVQADPIRAPARAQDLTLRHRVRHYRAGDLERRYESVDVHEDVFINYGFVTGAVQKLMHPREYARTRQLASGKRAQAILDFVRTRGSVHPREVDEHFSHGNVTNYWGGSSRATTHLLDLLHYRGLLRVARREGGIRIYAVHAHEPVIRDTAARRAHVDALVDVVVNLYAPVPGASLSMLVRRLQYAAPQWQRELGPAIDRARRRLAHARVDGIDWYLPQTEAIGAGEVPEKVRLLAPFDPVVWDRRRFELLWGWAYRFEAYTPAAKRKLGYYALPLLWRDRVIGWGNVAVERGRLQVDVRYAGARSPGGAFRRERDLEIDRLHAFLKLRQG